MAQPRPEPGSGGTSGKKSDAPAARGQNVSTNKIPPPVPPPPEASDCSDSEWEISVELVPLNELTAEQRKLASDGGPNDRGPPGDPKSSVDVVSLGHPPPVTV